jgi:DNA repair protein RadA/Sms
VAGSKLAASDGVVRLSEIESSTRRRISTGINSLDRLWGSEAGSATSKEQGAGIVTGSVTLIGGKAGAGKSTICLQIASTIALTQQRDVMLILAEESEGDIKARADRLRLLGKEFILIFPMGNPYDVVECLRNRKPAAVFFDSLPGFVSSPEEGVELCKALKPIAVDLQSPFIVIDHINKQDDFAGLEKLQHEVDTLITIFPTDEGELRELEVTKNRNGPANIQAHLLMTETGLHEVIAEIDDETNNDESDDP